ncbi:MAG: hypothetical protein HQ567_25440 [Candidatus Nealsonbacteria bacterium]|nr:hypothetical protein [Candidatus Nealsonbacteria bacterium]
MNERYIVVRVFLWIICIYHVVAGVAATFFKDAAVELGGVLFGVSITMTPQAELLVRYLGAFAISFGLMTAFAALDPQRNTKIIYGAVAYFLIRAFDRIVFWKLLQEHSTGPVPDWFRIVMILVFGLGLLAFMPRPRKTCFLAPSETSNP